MNLFSPVVALVSAFAVNELTLRDALREARSLDMGHVDHVRRLRMRQRRSLERLADGVRGRDRAIVVLQDAARVRNVHQTAMVLRLLFDGPEHSGLSALLDEFVSMSRLEEMPVLWCHTMLAYVGLGTTTLQALWDGDVALYAVWDTAGDSLRIPAFSVG